MPYLESSSYRAPFGFRNGHVQSIYSTLYRRVATVTTERERIETPDGDFLDLDWSPCPPEPRRRLAILSHGLEADSSQASVQGMAGAFYRREWDVLAWNFRGCSGEPNRLAKFYHSGATEDLQTVLDHVFQTRNYTEVALIGFSLGGNLTLKYLGDVGAGADERIRGAVAFSVPCELACSVEKLSGIAQKIYMRRFLRRLKKKIREKIEAHPQSLNDEGLDQMRTFREFDARYTAPLHGFASAEDYWTRCSCKRVLDRIRVRSLLVNALDDPFLGPGCYPFDEAAASERFFLETPEHGGHVGFVPLNRKGEYWSELRAAEFLGR